jgi:hypothetical protein
MEWVNAASCLAGTLVHFRLHPPLGQLPGLEAALGVPRAFPISFALLHASQLPFCESAAGAALGAAALAAHCATALRFRHSASHLRATAAAAGLELPPSPRSGAPWFTRLVPISPFWGLVPLLPSPPWAAGQPRVVVHRGISYYPGSSAPSSRCLLDVWHALPGAGEGSSRVASRAADCTRAAPASAAARRGTAPEYGASETTASPDGAQPRPVVLYLHGGAWNIGHRYWHADTALLYRLAAEGCVVFSASYRYAWSARARADTHACIYMRARSLACARARVRAFVPSAESCIRPVGSGPLHRTGFCPLHHMRGHVSRCGWGIVHWRLDASPAACEPLPLPSCRSRPNCMRPACDPRPMGAHCD